MRFFKYFVLFVQFSAFIFDIPTYCRTEDRKPVPEGCYLLYQYFLFGFTNRIDAFIAITADNKNIPAIHELKTHDSLWGLKLVFVPLPDPLSPFHRQD